ncbi:MAG TPA: ribosome biogenesis GTP-binding protein YihA/YsxC, partial [Gemmatimonadaceae bacterium]|nr:ribosome biogenesis GTP-binding protein YihA/YsxC [Gemmatimonadaceae bacterium]
TGEVAEAREIAPRRLRRPRAPRRGRGHALMVQPGKDPSDPLVIRELKFLGGMAAQGGWRPPEELPEVAFIGRSNVGKSSLLNLLVRRRAFARVSRTPGRTQEVNFFQVNQDLVLVDLPGYGYARVSRTKRHSWQPLIDGYLRNTTQLRGIVLLLDIRRDPNAEDLAMLDYLAELEIPTLVVITKVDKLGTTARGERMAALMAAIGVDPSQVIASSAHTGEGRNDLAEAVVSLVSQPAWRREGVAPGEER